MSFLDKIKSVFVMPESDKRNDAGSEINESKEQTESIQYSQNITDTGLGESREKFLDILNKVLESNNQSGFDYLEYKKAISSIAKLQTMDESTQFKTAFAAAMSMNVQPNQLIDSAKKYLNLLETESAHFNQTANQFLHNQVKTKSEESKQLQQSIDQKEKQLQQLQSEIEQNKNRLAVIEKEIQSANSKVESNKSSFNYAYKQLVDQIQSDIQKMEQFLK
jgi:chromosome segregation ATPase